MGSHSKGSQHYFFKNGLYFLYFVCLIYSHMIQMLREWSRKLITIKICVLRRLFGKMRYFENEWDHIRNFVRWDPHKHKKQSGSAYYINSYKWKYIHMMHQIRWAFLIFTYTATRSLEDYVLFKAAFVVEKESTVSAYFCFGSHFWN